MGRSKKNVKAPSRAKRLRNASKETAAKQQYRAIHVDVRERENVVRRELHETELLDPLVLERDNVSRLQILELSRLEPADRESQYSAT